MGCTFPLIVNIQRDMTPIIQKFVGIIYQAEQNVGFLFAKTPCQYADACYSDRMAHLTTLMQ